MVLTSSFQHVKGDHGVVVKQHRLVGDDESHATHISSKTVDMLTSGCDLDTVLQNSEIDFVEFVAELGLFHELVLFPVCAHDIAALQKCGWSFNETETGLMILFEVQMCWSFTSAISLFAM